MAKVKSYFLCRNCGAMHPKWMGKCGECGAWDSLEEQVKGTEDLRAPRGLTVERSRNAGGGAGESAREGAVAISEVVPLEVARVSTGLSELDRVLGGGVVPG